MLQLRLALRIAILTLVFEGIIQTLITYAVVPAKYENETYSAEEVKKIAYAERSEGINLLYEQNAINTHVFALLGVIAATEMWVTNRIDLSREREQTNQETGQEGDVSVLRHWPLVIATLLVIFSLTFLVG